jgi:hypothetical protein
MKWVGCVARIGKKRNMYKVLMDKPEGNMQIGSHRRRCEHNIKIDIQTTEWKTVDWINLVQDRDNCRALIKTALIHRFS